MTDIDWSLYGAATCASTEAAKDEPLTYEVLMQAMKAIDATPPDPIVQLMKDLGFDPADGAFLVIPTETFDKIDFGPFGPPTYIRSSHWVTEAVVVRPFQLHWGPVTWHDLSVP